MIQLPQSLSPWAQLLQLFPQDIAQELGELVRSLNTLIGPLNSDSLQGPQEPNGYSGISTSANYHRLLTSEWVLMDVFRDEFLRRAVSGEHLFHQLERLEPRVAKSSYVLFDCGPAQLGKPRIVQLALLILMARRAEKADAEFYWGVLQNPQKTWTKGLDAPAVSRWLYLRSCLLATNTDVAEWILDQQDSLQDFWIISPDNLTAPIPAKKIQIETLLLEEKRVQLKVFNKSSKKEMFVDLPSIDVQTRILRDPFLTRREAKNNSDWDHDFGWHLSPNGSLFAYMGCDSKVNSLRLPNASNKKIVNRDRYNLPLGKKLVGVYITRKRMCVVYSGKNQLFMYNYPLIGNVKTFNLTQGFEPRLRMDAIALTNDAKHKMSLLILDAKNSLRKIQLDTADGLMATLATDIIYFSHVDNCQFYVCYEKDTSRIRLTWLPQGGWPQECSFTVQTARAPACFAHGSRTWSKNQIGIFAYEFDATTWKIVIQGLSISIPVKPSQKIVGVLFLNEWSFNDASKENQTPCLVAIEEGRLHVSLLFENRQRKLITLPSEFERGEINCSRTLLHYTNSSRESITVCLRTGSELLRLTRGGENLAEAGVSKDAN